MKRSRYYDLMPDEEISSEKAKEIEMELNAEYDNMLKACSLCGMRRFYVAQNMARLINERSVRLDNGNIVVKPSQKTAFGFGDELRYGGIVIEKECEDEK